MELVFQFSGISLQKCKLLLGIYEGCRLFLENNWDWNEKYPVILLSFGGGVVKSRAELDAFISDMFMTEYEFYGLEVKSRLINSRFKDLIVKLNKKFNQRVVIIVDEYDKPILDNITDKKVAGEIRDGLKNIYSVIKDSDAYIKFAFLTGVSNFSKVSLFSGLNNLTDITLDKRYSAICGYTENDRKIVFQDRLKGLAKNKIKKWYDGYSFLGESLYNPFDILLYFDSGEFRNYWFQSATPTFLIDILQEKKYHIPDFENLKATENLLSSFDIDYMELETLLFQTGYLTIKDVRELGNTRVFNLSYPNLEVKMSLTDFILQYLTNQVSKKDAVKIDLYEILEENRLNDLKKVFYSFFASIPHDWYRKNEISAYEGYYSSIFYCYFTALGLDLCVEETTNIGQLDMSVKFEDRVYIFEFKVNKFASDSKKALKQIKEKKYYEKFGILQIYFTLSETGIPIFGDLSEKV